MNGKSYQKYCPITEGTNPLDFPLSVVMRVGISVIFYDQLENPQTDP